MRVVRYHSHTRRSAQLYGWGALALLGAVIALSLVNRTAASIPLLLLCVLGFQVFKEVMIPRAERWITGHMGERRVLTLLRDLPDTYVAITNFVVPGTERGDIDLILVGPFGVLVIEVKFYEGHILFEHGRWWRRQKNGWKTRLKKNPSAQAKGHRKALLAYLQQERGRHPATKDQFVPITAVVAFVGADSLDTGTLDLVALRAGDLVSYVRGLPPRLDEAAVQAVITRFDSNATNCVPAPPTAPIR